MCVRKGSKWKWKVKRFYPGRVYYSLLVFDVLISLSIRMHSSLSFSLTICQYLPLFFLILVSFSPPLSLLPFLPPSFLLFFSLITHSFIDSPTYSFVNSFIYSLVAHSPIRLLAGSHALIHSLFILSLIYLLTHSLAHSLTPLFPQSAVVRFHSSSLFRSFNNNN